MPGTGTGVGGVVKIVNELTSGLFEGRETNVYWVSTLLVRTVVLLLSFNRTVTDLVTHFGCSL